MPVFGTSALEYQDLAIGRRARELRRERNLSLQQVARRLGISIASLSSIENEKATLDLKKLVELSDALGVSPDTLFPRSQTSHFYVARHASDSLAHGAALKVIDPVSGSSTAYHNLLQPLAEPFVGKHIEPFQIDIQWVADDNLQFICHHHEEFFYVLRGEVECLVKTPDGLVREVLEPGDSMYFWSYLPHAIRSTAPNGSALCLHVLYSAHGATDSEQANGGSREFIYFRDVSHRSLTDQVSMKIASLRQARGMSAAEFARDLGIGVRQLAEIERGRKAVSIKLLLRLCRIYRKPIEHFLTGTLVDRPFHVVCRGSDVPSLPVRVRRDFEGRATHATTEYRALAEGFNNRGMHPYLVTMPRDQEANGVLREHHGQECIYVLRGEVMLTTILDNAHVTRMLAPGDACFIDSTVPHQFVARGSNPFDRAGAEILAIFWCPLGESYLFREPGSSPS